MRVRTVQIEPDVEDVIRAAKLDGNNLTLQGQLAPPMYKKVMKVLELIGFKWDRRAKCHVGEGDSAEKLSQALNAGACVDEKKTYQFYETPERLAGRMASLAGIKPGHRVLEPSAGRGAIVDAIFASGTKRERPTVVFACELDPRNVEFLKAADAERGVASETNGDPKQLLLVGDDFLKVDPEDGLYDRIVMNPPFTGGQDVEHVLHAYDLLSPGGRLVAITSPAWRSHGTKRMAGFREWYGKLQDEGLASIPEELPAGTFKESGTDVRTLLIVVQKP